MFGSKDLLFSSEKYGVAKSLRFRASASAYLSRTFGTPTSQNIWTYSCWVKRGALGADYNFGPSATGLNCQIYFSSANTLDFYYSGAYVFQTTQVFRDPSAWYHIVLAFNGAASGSNKVLLYVNGVQVTAFSTDNRSTFTTSIINTAILHGIGRYQNAGANYLDGYLAETYFIDGAQKAATDFGFYDNNGIWQPKGYTGTYGTNGFYLKFTDVGATSGANSGYGKDFSGFNTNYWTTNNFGTTSTATTYDSMYDSPVNASNGITGIGNYCVLNPLNTSGGTISNANLTLTASSSSVGNMILGSVGSNSLKYYFEVTVTKPDNGYLVAGVQNIANAPYATLVIASTPSYQWVWRDDGTRANNGAASAYGSALSNGGTVAVAVDPAGGKIWWGSASSGTVTWFGSPAGDPTAGTNAAYSNLSGVVAPCVGTEGWVTAASVGNFNAGQRPFVGAIPSGFSALNTQNLSTPTINNGAAYMAAVTYTGSASTQNVTATSTNSGNNPNAVTFQPDLVWIKDRTNAQSHKLTDAVRGTTKAISTDSTAAEATDANGVTAFNNNGFSLGTGTRAYSDSNLDSYVAWQWKKGVSQGFDIVSYAGDNTSNRNISHNLGVAPAFAWVKSLSTGSFYIYHQNLTGSTYFLKCNSTDGTNAQTNTNTPWGTGNWSSTQFMVTNNATNNLNASSTNYIGYLWAAIAGYSTFGSYAGNSSSDGPFVYTGFRPRYVMIKAITTGSVESWELWDTSRSPYNVVSLQLFANTSAAESDGSARPCILDILSNGFKIRGTNSEMNSSSYSYAYACFAENPFKISRAR